MARSEPTVVLNNPQKEAFSPKEKRIYMHRLFHEIEGGNDY